MKSFSFGTFDVGYLEDKNDPNSNNSIPKEKIRSIDAKASTLSSIPERDFHGHDVYGDIRFNPNETCGGPLLLWRSHNDFSRTYHKTLIVRDIKDPDKAALEASKNTASLVGSSASSSSSGATGSTSSTTDSAALADTAMSDLATWQADGDSDGIPDRGDDDNGDVFEVSTSGNSTQISIGLGKVDDVLDDIIGGVKEFLSGLSCGFGDAGCISMPINWAANIPGNTITALGFALP